jgi:hypothetical protein
LIKHRMLETINLYSLFTTAEDSVETNQGWLEPRKKRRSSKVQTIMPFGILGHVLTEYKLDHWQVARRLLTKYGIWIGLAYGLRKWSAGGSNQHLRQMASRVVIVTV